MIKRIAGVDTGTQKDRSAMVSCVCDTNRNLIFIEAAKHWLRFTEFHTVETDIERYALERKFDQIRIEANGGGREVYQNLKRLGLPVVPIDTVAKLGSLGTRKRTKAEKRGLSMAKSAAVHYHIRLKKLHLIKYPTVLTPELEELRDQQEVFTEDVTPTGQARYNAPNQSHDDLYMAQLHALWGCKPYITMQRTKPSISQVRNAAWNPRRIDRELVAIGA